MKTYLIAIGILLQTFSVHAAGLWGGLGQVEQLQVLQAAEFCNIAGVYSWRAQSTTVLDDGSVGYQGVYNYIYTTTLVGLDQNHHPILGSRVVVVSQHLADIDTNPVSYTFQINKVSAGPVACNSPQ